MKKKQVDKVDTARRKSKRTPKPRRDWKTRFLSVLRKTANVSAACKAAHVSREGAYKARSVEGKESTSLVEAEQFAAAWDETIEAAVDDLEAEARRRALVGLVRKKFTRTGDPIMDPETRKQYFEMEYSDALLQTLLRAHRPQKYSERSRNENFNVDLSTLNNRQLELLANGASISDVLAAAGSGPAAAALPSGGDPPSAA